jgi:transcriptional regulator with XRE-family HTH domain
MNRYPESVRAQLARLGEGVRLARAERGWTQVELAERLGTSPMTVKKIESGAPGTAFGTILEVCSLLNISPDPDRNSQDLNRSIGARVGIPQRVRRKRIRQELDV